MTKQYRINRQYLYKSMQINHFLVKKQRNLFVKKIEATTKIESKHMRSPLSPIQESRFNIYWTKKWNGSSKSLSKYLSHLQQKKIASSINLCPLKILELNNPCWLLLDFFLEPINPYIQLQFYFSTFNPTVSHTQNPSKKPQH